MGIDIQKKSILEAKKNSTKNLDFFIHDMRLPFSIKNFDALFNLFNEPTWFKGRRTIRECSAIACNIDCRIHHTA